MEFKEFDLIVIGSGHAGLEAALISDKFKLKVGLVSLSFNRVGDMPCNPSVGGIAKGHLVREIDALGGEMGKAIDQTGIQFRMLNKSKGPAVWGPRAQADKKRYIEYFQDILAKSNIEFIEDEVTAILTKNHIVQGVNLKNQGKILCKKVIITTGTFLRGKLFVGNEITFGGSYGNPPANELSKSLIELGFTLGRLKTGTPARIYKNSIDFSKTIEQKGDKESYSFSHWHNKHIDNKVSCFITFTNNKTHEIIREGLAFSPLYTGKIQGVGPRYCPSIEDKVVKFPTRDRHQIFLEPEGLESDLIYPNGISSSLPKSYQDRFLRTLPGLENIEIARYGYAVEYDFVNPVNNYKTLESKLIKGLYFAGQINGTSGYEEAAAQGLMAGYNASLSLLNEPPFILKDSEAYIGVLLDDLVLKGVDEPYRLFTSQAEYRLLLRQDNAIYRLGEYAKNYGILNEKEIEIYNAFVEQKNELKKLINETKIKSDNKRYSLKQYIKMDLYKGIDYMKENFKGFDKKVIFTAANDIKYSGYMERYKKRMLGEEKLNIKIPKIFNYDKIKSLKTEAREKFKKFKPETLLDASKIPGINKNDIQILYISLKK